MHRQPPGMKRRCAQCARSGVLRSWRAKIPSCSSIRLVFPNKTWQQNMAEATCGPYNEALPVDCEEREEMLTKAYSRISTPSASGTTPFPCRGEREKFYRTCLEEGAQMEHGRTTRLERRDKDIICCDQVCDACGPAALYILEVTAGAKQHALPLDCTLESHQPVVVAMGNSPSKRARDRAVVRPATQCGRQTRLRQVRRGGISMYASGRTQDRLGRKAALCCNGAESVT